MSMFKSKRKQENDRLREEITQLRVSNNGHRDGYWFETVFGIVRVDGDLSLEHVKRQESR